MILTIGDTQWSCTLALTSAEIMQGLSGVESLTAGTGMLFDLGTDYSRIDINMDEMLFPLDIIFINSNMTVVGVLHDVQPSDEAYFLASSSLGARCFMEVNAGEAASVNVGDIVVMQDGGLQVGGIELGTIVAAVVLLVVMGAMMKLVRNVSR